MFMTQASGIWNSQRTDPYGTYVSTESERSDYGRFVTIILNWMLFDCSPHTQHF